jgi:hypothetical protein
VHDDVRLHRVLLQVVLVVVLGRVERRQGNHLRDDRLAEDLRAGQLLLTNLDKRLDYATLAARLPDWAAPAHDGLEMEI